MRLNRYAIHLAFIINLFIISEIYSFKYINLNYMNNLFTNSLNPQYNPPLNQKVSGRNMDSMYNISGPNNSHSHSTVSDATNIGTAFRENKPWPVQGFQVGSDFTNWDFKNKNNIIHNNLEKNILINDYELVREYPLIIDSKDRDFTKYPSPFNFTIPFNPLSGTSGAYISDILENVKYIKLEKAIIPYYYKTTNTLTVSGDNYVINNSISLNDYPYNILSINELIGQNDYATSASVKKSFELLYKKKEINTDHFYALGSYIKVFPKDDLFKLNKMTIKMEKYTGILPTFTPDLSVPLLQDYKCICNVDSNSILTPLVSKCSVHYTKHPLYYGFQTQFTFKVGIYEPHFNKKVFD